MNGSPTPHLFDIEVLPECVRAVEHVTAISRMACPDERTELSYKVPWLLGH